MKFKFLPACIIVLIISLSTGAQTEPLGILLTWTQSPTTTISIDWHTTSEQPETLYYREKGTDEWNEEGSSVHPFPYTDRFVNRVALSRLKPGTSYELRFGKFENIYWFNTMPANIASNPIRIAIGGDTMGSTSFLKRTNEVVSEYEPHFIVMCGDLAYENGNPELVGRVTDWFEVCKNTLITADNQIFPIVAGIGNHEVRGSSYHPDRFSGNDTDREKHAPFFYNLYAFPGHPGYNVLDFGNYLSLFILDTGHTNPVEGKQTEWLKTKLNQRKNVTHLIPVYHVGAYPSARNFDGSTANRIRFNWLPLFEEYNIKLAFENHDHTYKRTFPLKRNEINENGIVFIGDGAWGVGTREVHDLDEAWYLKKAMSQRHFILLTLEGTHQQVTVISDTGEIIDMYPEPEQALLKSNN